MITVEQVWDIIASQVDPLPSESIASTECARRVLREKVIARENNPPFNQSAVDGYAFAEQGTNGWQLVAGTDCAGDMSGVPLHKGEARRILTGGVVPPGTIFIAKEEDCVADMGFVTPPSGHESGDFIRPSGGVWPAGEMLLPEGTRLGAGDAGLLAALGYGQITVTRQPGVLHLVTGNEIHRGSGSPPAGMVRDSNGPLIAALCRAGGVEIRQQWIEDKADSINSAVAESREDVILISGGSGRSERDFARPALTAAGFVIHVDGVDTRPGRPFILGQRGAQVALGLPGNPLSHFVCYHIFVRAVFAALQGTKGPTLRLGILHGDARAGGDGRRSWLPAKLVYSDRGTILLEALQWVHSGDLRPVAEAGALISMDGGTAASRGTLVPYLDLAFAER